MPAHLHLFFTQVSRLSLREIWLLGSMASMLLALPVLQRVLTLPALVTLFGARKLPTVLPPLDPDRLLYLTRGLLQQHIGVFRPNCLKQSLVLLHFLRQWNYPVALYVGVARYNDTLAGHCWLELGDQPMAEPDDPRRVFTIVYGFPENHVYQRRNGR